MKIDVLYFEGCPNHHPIIELAKAVVADMGVDAETNPSNARRRYSK